MATNYININPQVQELNASYVPNYDALFSIITNTQEYDKVIKEYTLTYEETKGPIKAKIINPQDTETAVFSVGTNGIKYNSYIKPLGHRRSLYQSGQTQQAIIDEVLDSLLRQLDQMAFFGDTVDGTEANIRNDGLFFNSNSRYYKPATATYSQATGIDGLLALIEPVVKEVSSKSGNVGTKVIIPYGTLYAQLLKFVPASGGITYRAALEGALSEYNVFFKKLPDGLVDGALLDDTVTTAPNIGDGFLVFNTSQLKLHFTALPLLENTGVSEEFKYRYYSFLLGSIALELKAKAAAARQAVTITA
jgi:hypothetical protein